MFLNRIRSIQSSNIRIRFLIFNLSTYYFRSHLQRVNKISSDNIIMVITDNYLIHHGF